VEASSPGLGRGCTFTIRLPLAAIVRQKAAGEAQLTTEIEPPAPGLRVLIADDNRDAADSLALMLQMSGHTVAVAYSGPEALAAALRERPEALILDIGMPGMTGYELARRVRQQAWGRHVLLLAITGWGHHDDKERAAAAGFDAHLTKPANTETLQQLLADFALRREASRATRAGSLTSSDSENAHSC